MNFEKYIIDNQIESIRVSMNRGPIHGNTEEKKPYEFYTRTTSGARRSILSTSVKWSKNKGFEDYGVTGLYLAPATMVEGLTTCRWRGKCEKGCIGYTGFLGMFQQESMEKRTLALYHHTKKYLVDMLRELYLQCFKASIDDKQLFCRLNGTSDIPFYRVLNMDAIVNDFNGLAGFYDYTKCPRNFNKWDNYHLTYSWSEKTWYNLPPRGHRGFDRMAMVVTKKTKNRLLEMLPSWFCDGDEHDMRSLDKRRYVLLQVKNVTAKGRGGVDADFVMGFDDVLEAVAMEQNEVMSDYFLSLRGVK